MKSAVENLDQTRVKLTVEVPLTDLQPSLDRAYKEVAQQVSIPGFRKGKVPPRIIDQRVGKAVVMEQAVNEALPGLYRDAVVEAGIKPIGQPSVEVTGLPGVAESEDLVFTAEVDVRPEITLPDLSEITLTVDDVEVTDEDVETELTTLRERYATLVGVERPAADGDFVTLDLTATIEEEEIDSVSGVSYQIGAGNMLEGLDEALTGLSAGETTTFSSALVGGDHAGEDAEVTVTASVIKEQELPEVDDDFAQMASEHDTVEELKESLRTQAADAKRNEQAIQARDKLIEHLQEAADFPIPTGVVEDEVTRHLAAEGREDDTEHGEEVRVETTEGLRRQLLLDVLAEQVDVKIGQNEVLEFMLNTARQYQMDPNELIKNASENGQMPSFIAEVTRNKSVATALRQVKVVDSTGAEVDLTDYIGSDEEDAQMEAEAQAAAVQAAAGPATELVDVDLDEGDDDAAAEAVEGTDAGDQTEEAEPSKD
ncbi:trigger factor [Pseudactinotalea sp. Z1732]|uniref:trigger factor n=1 Tax=Pseudactinotalea sp. Z1732 TaxID=3413026 RepID=UPI003C7BB9A9